MKPIIIDANTLIVMSVCYLITNCVAAFIKGFVDEHFHQRRLSRRKSLEEHLIATLKSDVAPEIKSKAIEDNEKTKNKYRTGSRFRPPFY